MGKDTAMLHIGSWFRESGLEMGTAFLFPKVIPVKNASVNANISTFNYFLMLSCLKSLTFFFPPQICITAPSPFQNDYTQSRYFPHIPWQHFIFSANKTDKGFWCGWTAANDNFKKYYWKARNSNCIVLPLSATEVLILTLVRISQNNEKEVQGWRPVGYGGRDHIHYHPKNSEIVLAKVGIGAVHGRTLKTSCLPCWCAVVVAGIAVCVSPRTAGAAAGSLTAGGPGRSGEGEQTACAPAGDAAGVCVLKGRPVLHQPETVHGGAVLKDTSLKIIWRKKNSREEKKEEKKEGRKCLLSNADGDNDI